MFFSPFEGMHVNYIDSFSYQYELTFFNLSFFNMFIYLGSYLIVNFCIAALLIWAHLLALFLNTFFLLLELYWKVHIEEFVQTNFELTIEIPIYYYEVISFLPFLNYDYNYSIESYTLSSYFFFTTIFFCLLSSVWIYFIFFFLVIYFFFSSFFYDIYISLNLHISIFFYQFIYNLIMSYLGRSYMYLFPILGYFFIVVFFFNIIGLTPFSFPMTSQLGFTLSLSLFAWVSSYFTGLVLHGSSFFRTFVLVDIPILVLVPIIFLEILSYLIRIMSFALRLFSNVVAGHMILHVFMALVHNIIFSYLNFSAVNIVTSFLVCFFFGLLVIVEFAVSFLQSYVVLLLVIIYIRGILSIKH